MKLIESVSVDPRSHGDRILLVIGKANRVISNGALISKICFWPIKYFLKKGRITVKIYTLCSYNTIGGAFKQCISFM